MEQTDGRANGDPASHVSYLTGLWVGPQEAGSKINAATHEVVSRKPEPSLSARYSV